MSKVKSIKIVITIGVLVLLKISMDSIPRISEPLSNTVVFIGIVIITIIFGMSYMTQKAEKKIKEE